MKSIGALDERVKCESASVVGEVAAGGGAFALALAAVLAVAAFLPAQACVR